MHLSRNTRALTFLVCLTIVISCFAPVSLAATQSTAVTTGSAMFRTGPGTNYSSQGQLTRGTQVVVLDTTNSEWWKISYDGKEGYAASKYLKITGSAPAAVSTVTATVTGTTSMLTKAGSGGVVATVKSGAVVTVLDSTSSATWWRISVGNKEGYVRRIYLKLTNGAAATTAAPTAKPAPSSKPTGSSSSSGSVTVSGALASKIANAKGINSDTVGWIKVPNTNVDEPILYGANFYYASHNIYRKKSYDGVYPFYNKATKNIVVFGHNMRGSATIFHQLHHLQEAALGFSKCQSGQCGRGLSSSLKDWYKSSSGRVWDIAIYGKQKWEVFAMYEVKASEPISTLRNNWSPLSGSNSAAVQKWIDGQLKRSQINFGVSVDSSDQLMTLITCGNNYDYSTANSRLFVFLKNVD